MKIDSRLIAAALLAGAVHLAAAPLTETAAVQTLPDSGAPVITLLKAGTEPVLAPAPAEGIPAGWTAVQVSGPFEAYVRNADLTKQLEVRPGASLLLAPKATAGVLTVFAKGDQARITGLLGSWTQVSLDKTLVGYLSCPRWRRRRLRQRRRRREALPQESARQQRARRRRPPPHRQRPPHRLRPLRPWPPLPTQPPRRRP